MSDISTRIQELQVQLETIDRSERYRKELKKRLEEASKKRGEQARIVDKERRDVDELESWSLKEIFVKVTNKEEKLEKEKEEYLQAAIALNEADKEIEMIQFELGILDEKITSKASLHATLKELHQQRQEEILRNDPNHPLKPVLHEIARLQQIDREFEEALERGGNTRLLLIEVGRHIHSAKSWTNKVLHDRPYRSRKIAEEVDGARLRLPKLRMEFTKFESELKEIFQFPEFERWKQDQWSGLQQIHQLVEDLSGLTRRFVKGFMRELLVQKQLHDTLTLIDNLGHRLASTLKWLGTEQERLRTELAEWERQKRDLLI